jgi:hypothetical protein
LGAAASNQQLSNADLKDTLCLFGFQLNGSASPLNLDGGDISGGKVTGIKADSTDGITEVLHLGHDLIGTPSVGFGTRLTLAADTNGASDRTQAEIETSWQTVTDASRKARVVHRVYDTAARECIRLEADGTNPLLGFFGATAVGKPGATADVKDALVNLGLITDSGATPLNLDGGALTCGNVVATDLDISVNDGVTNTQTEMLTLTHTSTGTVADVFGLQQRHKLESDNGTTRDAFLWITYWSTAADATRKARVEMHVYDTTNRMAIQMGTNGSAPTIGFLGAGAIARPSVTGSKGGNAALSSLVAQLAALGLITDNTT